MKKKGHRTQDVCACCSVHFRVSGAICSQFVHVCPYTRDAFEPCRKEEKCAGCGSSIDIGGRYDFFECGIVYGHRCSPRRCVYCLRSSFCNHAAQSLCAGTGLCGLPWSPVVSRGLPMPAFRFTSSKNVALGVLAELADACAAAPRSVTGHSLPGPRRTHHCQRCSSAHSAQPNGALMTTVIMNVMNVMVNVIKFTFVVKSVLASISY